MTAPRRLVYHGEELPAPSLARRVRVPLTTLLSRIDRLGWSVERAADTPVDKRFRRGGRKKAGAPRPCPKLEKHKSGRAYCRWREGQARRAKWFGEWGSEPAREGYARFAAEWAAHHGPPPGATPRKGALVADLIVRFMLWASTHYRKNGAKTSELYAYKSATRSWARLYGSTRVDQFRPSSLRTLRAKWVNDGLSRDTANRYTSKVVRVVAWGVGQDGLVPAEVLGQLREVEPLVAGKTEAPDAEPVPSVSDAIVDRTLPHIHADPGRAAVLSLMVRVQRLTGMRPGELCAMLPEYVDRSASPWCYDTRHANKSLHREKPRKVWIGPKARGILGPVLDAAERGAPVWRFPPRGKAGRQTAVTRLEYARFVKAACRRAGVDPWTPNQIRHARATEVHDRYEDDAAVAALLGNTPEVSRQVYVDSPEDRVARRIAEATG